MASVEPDHIRSFTLLGAPGTGKTSLAEALLYGSGSATRLGSVEDKSSHLDVDPEEQRRKITLTSKIQKIDWQKDRFYFADTPGFADFIGETIAPLAVLDAVVLVVDATVGVDVSTKQFFQWAMRRKKPILFFINKMDKEKADFEKTLESIQTNLSKHAFPVSLPLGSGPGFRGVLDLIDRRVFLYEGGHLRESSIPFEETERFNRWQKRLIEEVAETDEALFEKLAAGQELKKEDILPRLIEDIEAEEILPVLVGSSVPPQGTHLLLDTLAHLILPSTRLPPIEGLKPQNQERETRRPHPFEPVAAQVFKVVSDPGVGDVFFLKVFSGTLRHGSDLFNPRTQSTERLGHLFHFTGKDRHEVGEAVVGEVVGVAKLKSTKVGDTLCDGQSPIQLTLLDFPLPVLTMGIRPKTRKDQEKLGFALGKLTSNDPTFHFHTDPEFSETVVSGMGEMHIEVIAERLKGRYGIDLDLVPPQVPYRETITRQVRVQGKYKKQSGGHGQYGDVWISVEPRSLGEGFEFVDEIKGGVIPGKYIPAVEAGIRDSMQKGMLAGYPVVDVKVTLCEGTFHSVDSSDLAFQIAGSMAFKKAEEEGRSILLEPIMKVEVISPPEFVGAITNDLTARRGKIVGMDQAGELHITLGEVPLAELFKYATALHSLTHGQGTHRMEFARYEPLPVHLMEKVKESSVHKVAG